LTSSLSRGEAALVIVERRRDPMLGALAGAPADGRAAMRMRTPAQRRLSPPIVAVGSRREDLRHELELD